MEAPLRRGCETEAENFSNDMVREGLRELFRAHDENGDRRLSYREITKAFGFLGSVMPFYRAGVGLKRADSDGDGMIDEDELDSLIDFAMKFTRNNNGRQPIPEPVGAS